MKHTITLIPGDGIGPEVTNATCALLAATRLQIEWESFSVGAEALAKQHSAPPRDLLQTVLHHKNGADHFFVFRRVVGGLRFDKFAVTVEPAGGVPKPTGPMVLLGTL